MQRSRLTSAVVDRSLRLSVVEGVAFSLMVGLGETWFLADAIRLSSTRLQQGLVVGLPLFVGSLGPLLALRVLARARSRKPLVVAAAVGQALLLFALAASDLLGWATPTTLMLLAAGHGVCGQAGGTAWSSWFGDLIPRTGRGRRVAIRSRAVYVGTCLGMLGAGALLSGVEEALPRAADRGGGTGFALAYALAGLARLGSAALHARIAEPRFHGLSSGGRTRRYLSTPKGVGARRVLTTSACFYFMVYLASPYFAPYMLEDLRFGYLEYTVASLAIVVGKVAFLPAWGRLVDQLGARAAFLACALFTSLVPLPWLWVGGVAWISLAQAISGVAWAGYELSLYSTLLERSYRGVRPSVFATQSLLYGVAQLAGTLGGAVIAASFVPNLRWLFALSMLGRLLFTAGLPRLLPPGIGEASVGRHVVLMRVLGIRPSGGLALRPLVTRREEEGEARP